MLRELLILAITILAAGGFTPQLAGQQSCERNGADALAVGNRTAAIQLARQINNAQLRSLARQHRYLTREDLSVTVPEGLVLNLVATDEDYLFTIADATDPCGHSIMSGRSGLILEGWAIR